MSKLTIADATADCVLPEDMMLCILTRLPVKSLLRFKSVCKPWRELFATPKFIKLHHDQFSSDPENEAFIIYSRSETYVVSMSLFSIESNAKKPTNLDLPYLESFFGLCCVGCCNGLVCIGFDFQSLLDLHIAFWNPALRLSKSFQFPPLNFSKVKKTSYGFGYDAEGGDFKLVRIVCLEEKSTGDMVEVYSAKSYTLKTIQLAFKFNVLRRINDAIVNGNPYWVAKIDQDESGEVLVWCDLPKLKFKIVPLSTLKLVQGAEVSYVDWKGSLAALVSSENRESLQQSVDVWVFDDTRLIWRKKHTFGPIEMRVDRWLQCSKREKIIGDCLDGEIFVFDPENGWVKEIEISEGRKDTFRMYGYTESLAYIKGMEKVVVKREEKEEEVEVEVEEDPLAGPA